MRKSSVVILVLVVLSNLLIWAMFNQAQTERPWLGTINGVSFSPFQRGQDPFQNKYPNSQDIDRDLSLLQDKVTKVRTYSSANGLEVVPQIASRYNLQVTAGAWLDKRLDKNETEVRNLIKNAQQYRNINRVIVGNETILRSDLTKQQLIDYLRRVRALTNVPVSTAEPWHVWLKYPELAEEVDFVAIHILPYWESVASGDAVNWAVERYKQVKAAFPDKHVVIGEVGWPSAGNRFGKAKATLTNQAKFVRNFLNVAAEHEMDYFIMEAFDQPWKRGSEGSVGQHWGLYDVDRHDKFSMTEDIVETKLWSVEAIAAAILALLPMLFFLYYWQNLRLRGQLFFAALIQLAASAAIWTACLPLTVDLTLSGEIVWGILFPAQLALLAVVLINGLELAEVVWIQQWRRHFLPLTPTDSDSFPKVSLHLAICNEPPDMVIQTLDSLARLDYPDYEVLVIDNNTVDPEIWQPVENHCVKLGARFRFFHLGKYPGFKAGALNFALRETHPDAEVIGIVDSDYIVQPNWLRALVPYFAKAEVGFVQAPQDNREWQDDTFKTMCNWEYAGFFHIGMVHRNERNAIIQHGTMTLIRRSALAKVGNWSEWCICEDAELGMRLMQQGYESVYVNHNFGQGLVPDSYAGYKRQRFRWVYGAVQILRRHWRWLTPFSKSGLTLGQRFHFVTGWLPWFTDALHLLFTFVGVIWTIGLVSRPDLFEFPLAIFLIPTIGMFIFKMGHALWLYYVKVNCTFWQRIGAAIAGMGLTHTIARAIWLGLTTTTLPFMRTPKGENKPALVKGLLMAWEEFQMLVLLWLATASVLLRYGTVDPEANIWMAVLLVQSVPYLAALFTAVVSVAPTFRWNPVPSLSRLFKTTAINNQTSSTSSSQQS